MTGDTGDNTAATTVGAHKFGGGQRVPEITDVDFVSCIGPFARWFFFGVYLSCRCDECKAL